MSFFQVVAPFVAQNPRPPAPTPAPTPTPSPDVELLMKQVEFLKDANTHLTDSFNAFISTINTAFVLVGILLGVLGLVGTFLYGKTLSDVKQSAGALVTQEVNRIVSQTIKERVDYLERVLEREEVIGWITIDYLLLTNRRPDNLPEECKLLQNRGFQAVKFRHSLSQSARQARDIVVLDFVNHDFTDDEASTIAEQVMNNFSPQSVLVIYVGRRVPAFDNLLNGKNIYYTLANNTVTLMARVVDSAHIAYALRGGK
jgi:hypothetical protein